MGRVDLTLMHGGGIELYQEAGQQRIQTQVGLYESKIIQIDSLDESELRRSACACFHGTGRYIFVFSVRLMSMVRCHMVLCGRVWDLWLGLARVNYFLREFCVGREMVLIILESIVVYSS